MSSAAPIDVDADTVVSIEAAVKNTERYLEALKASSAAIVTGQKTNKRLRMDYEDSEERVHLLEAELAEMAAKVVEMEAKALVLEERNAQLSDHLSNQEEVVAEALEAQRKAEAMVEATSFQARATAMFGMVLGSIQTMGVVG